MFKRAAIGILLLIATVAGKPLGDAISAAAGSVGPTQQILSIVIAVTLSGALIGFLETKRALALNWWWHRFWFMHEVAKHLTAELTREMAGDITAGDRLGPDITIDAVRRPLVPYLSAALLERRQPAPRFLVLGRPGGGKSVAMMQLARSLASRGRWQFRIGRSMPVLIRMGGVRKEPLLAYAGTVMTTQTRGRSGSVLAQGLDDLVRKGRIILILDALDEIARDARDGVVKDVRALAAPAYARMPLVITARTDDVRAGEFPGLELAAVSVEDLDDGAVDAFIARFGARLSEEAGRPLREQLERTGLLDARGLARNPFWLRLMLDSGVLENDRTEIVTQAIARVLSREWDERPDARRGWRRVRERDTQLQLTRQALGWLAYQMWLSGSRELELEYASLAVSDALAKRAGVTDLSAEDVLALARDAQIVDYTVGTGSRLQFRHAILQDFFTATALSSESGLLTAALVASSTNDPRRWSALIAADQMSKRGQTGGVVARLLRERPDEASLWLVAGMFSSLDRWLDADNHKAAIDAIASRLAHGPTDAHRRAATELARVSADRFSGVIRDLMDSGSTDVRQATADLVQSAVATLVAQRQGFYLIEELLGAPNLDAAVDLIASAGSDVVPDVIELAVTTRVLTQMRALQVLQRLGDARSVEPLVALLDRTTGIGVTFVAQALGSTKDHRAIAPLLAKIRTGDPIVAMPALDALADLGAIAIPTLIELLNSDKYDALASLTAKTKLREIGPLAVPLLRVALGSPNDSVRASAASLLVDVADATAVPELTAATQDEDLLVQASAITALGRLGADGVSPLVALIESPSLDTWRTLHAQQALAAIGAEAVNGVLAATHHADTAIRERAVQTLGVMRQPAAVDRLSALLTSDPETGVRAESAVALGRCGGTAVEARLRAALDDPFDLVNVGAMAGLAESGNAEGRTMLIDGLAQLLRRDDTEDAIWPLRYLVAQRLAELREEQALPMLRELVRRAQDLPRDSVVTLESLQALITIATSPEGRPS